MRLFKKNQSVVSKFIEIDMGHRIPNHKSKCRNLHGHRYRIECSVIGRVISKKGDSSEGMVIDFGDLKNIMKSQIEDVFDHKFVLWHNDILVSVVLVEEGLIFVDFIPTAENLAKHWYTLLKVELKKVGIQINYVKVWETPTSAAIYEI